MSEKTLKVVETPNGFYLTDESKPYQPATVIHFLPLSTDDSIIQLIFRAKYSSMEGFTLLISQKEIPSLISALQAMIN